MVLSFRRYFGQTELPCPDGSDGSFARIEPLRPWKREQLGYGYDCSTWLEKTATEMADAVVAVSQGTRSDILRLFNIDPARVHIIYNGIDPEEYYPRKSSDLLPKYGIDPDEPFILFVQLNIRPEINRMIDLGAAREEITRSQYIENLVETAAREARERKTELEGARRIPKSGGV